MSTPFGVVKRVRADVPEAVRLFYRGAGTVTSVTVTTATDIVLISSDGGTQTYAFGTYATIGALVDAINLDYNNGDGAGKFEAIVVDALRSHATASQFINGVVSVAADRDSSPYYPVKVDTSAAKIVSCAWAGSEFTNKHRPASRPVHLKQIQYFATLGAAGANGILIYERDMSGGETQLMAQGSVSASAQTIGFGDGGHMSVKPGSTLIVILADGTSISDTSLYLQISVLTE